MEPAVTQEEIRLAEDRERTAYWRRWGPYLSERQWGTVREDYSATGDAWRYFPHDQARSRAYRWGEDGIAGISDNHQRLCFALALWNGTDPILKERYFGLSGLEGNHSEDVKEYYFYLDNTPTHSYMKCLYKYPHQAFPYQQLVDENQRRNRWDMEYELLDTGIFDDDRYCDVVIEYAKHTPEDILIKITATNHGPETQLLHLLPTLWFRNTWSWHQQEEKPELKAILSKSNFGLIEADHATLGKRWLYCADLDSPTPLLFTENQTNTLRLFHQQNSSPYVKDGIHEYVVHGHLEAINPSLVGTKCAAHYQILIPTAASQTIYLRLCDLPDLPDPFGSEFTTVFEQRRLEADLFYDKLNNSLPTTELKALQRQALAGLLWTKQFYYFVIEDWLKGDCNELLPPPERKHGRNKNWLHIFNDDILSMPDKWEYPYYCAWDLAFHSLVFAHLDLDFAKHQLDRMTREWYMHPNGQLPAYEWNFSDVNPPVHAWAAWRIYKYERQMTGKGDLQFLEQTFQKLLINFTWWVNRQDIEGNNVFQGGFLGMDNIGVFDRSAVLPTGGYIYQADGTSWMAMYALNMLAIAIELALEENSDYADIASKFFEHFLRIATAMNTSGLEGGLWDSDDGFFYDVLKLPDERRLPIKARSMVGLAPLFAIELMPALFLERFPSFKRRMDWFINNRQDLTQYVACLKTPGSDQQRLLSLVTPGQLRRILQYLFSELEFLSPHGIRSVSKIHEQTPCIFRVDGQEFRVDYWPAESHNAMFGGNSNWRGPVWFPMNYLLIESLRQYYTYFGDDFTVEFPTGSGHLFTLKQVAKALAQRLVSIFLRDEKEHRPVYGGIEKFQTDPHWRDLFMFHEYFHGDNGAGLGASHQTGWTALVVNLIRWSEET